MEQAWKEPLAVLAKALLSSPHKAGLGMKILFKASTTYPFKQSTVSAEYVLIVNCVVQRIDEGRVSKGISNR